MRKRTPRAAIYCRLSRNRGGERSASTERQEAECRKLAEAKGWAVEMVLVDDDVSAYSGRPRPGYKRLLGAIGSGLVDGVLAWAPDRLHRSPVELEGFVDLIERTGVEVATVQAGRVDLETPAGRLQARMLGNVARFESEHRSERTKLAHEQIAAEGRWKGGRRPYGYQPQPDGSMVIVEAEAAVIREAVARVLDGERVGAVANDFQRRQVPTLTGAAWRGPTLRRTITSPTIAGRRVYLGEDVGLARWPPIVSPDEVAEVVAVLARGSRRGRVPRVALLTGGRLVCDRCTKPMSTAQRDNGARIYRCLSCYAQVAAEPLEALVSDVLCWRLDRAQLPEPRAAVTSVSALTAQLEQLAEDHGAGLITRAEWMAARKPLTARLEEAHQEAGSAADVASLVELVGEGRATAAWPDLSLDRRQGVFDAMIAEVRIRPATKRGRGLDEDRVDVRWRA